MIGMKNKPPIVPTICEDCEHLCITQAVGMVEFYGTSVGTCRINTPPPNWYPNDWRWKGVYFICEEVLKDKENKFKCVKKY